MLHVVPETVCVTAEMEECVHWWLVGRVNAYLNSFELQSLYQRCVAVVQKYRSFLHKCAGGLELEQQMQILTLVRMTVVLPYSLPKEMSERVLGAPQLGGLSVESWSAVKHRGSKYSPQYHRIHLCYKSLNDLSRFVLHGVNRKVMKTAQAEELRVMAHQ